MRDLPHDQWQSLSEHLDKALELDADEVKSWLAELETRNPPMAALVARALAERDRDGYSQFLAGYSPGLAEQQPAASLIGRRVGPYVIEAELGHGGMGTVWRGRRADGRFEATVAIKFLQTMWLGPEGESRFRQEGTLLARLDHPNIARLLDAGILDGTQPYLVLEYVDGLPIDEYCRRHQLGLEARIALFSGVLAAVAHAHSHLIVHRDLKPSNVFVTHEGVIKLLDFGIAKLLGEDADAGERAQLTVAALTPEYASPEQWLAQPVTTATDVYALGLILYLLLTGKTPLADASRAPADRVRLIVDREPPLASGTVPGDPRLRRALEGDLDNILARALRIAPAARYPTASAFADDLRRYLRHEPVSARPDSAAYRASRFIRRHRGAVAGALLTLVALVMATIVTTTQWLEARRQRDFAQVQLKRARAFGDLAQIVLGESTDADHPLTTAQILERGERLVRTEFASTDDVRAQLLLMLGDLHTLIGVSDKQRELYAESNAIAKRSGDAGLIAWSGCGAAQAEASLGARRDAAERIEAYLAALPRDSANDVARVACWQFASIVARQSGREDHALEAAERAAQLVEHAPAATEWDRLLAMMTLADARRSMGLLGAADADYARIAEEYKRIGVDDTSYSGALNNNWGIALINLGMPNRALPLLEKAMAQAGGLSHLAPTMATNYAIVLVQLGRTAAARDLLEAALQRALAANDQRAVAAVRVGLARTSIELNELDRAEQLIAQLDPVLPRMLPAGHEAFGAVHQNRAQLLMARGDGAGALAEMDRAIEIFALHRGLAYRAAIAREIKARILLAARRIDEARADLKTAKDAFAAIAGRDAKSYYLGRMWLTEARIDERAGDSSAMRLAAHDAYDHFVATVGDTHPLAVESRALAGTAP